MNFEQILKPWVVVRNLLLKRPELRLSLDLMCFGVLPFHPWSTCLRVMKELHATMSLRCSVGCGESYWKRLLRKRVVCVILAT